MKSNYKKLGNYIQQVKEKNKDLKVENLQGISIFKEYMSSVANIIGTDMSKYRIVKRNQFAYNPMHVGRDEVLPISLFQKDEEVIVSPAYTVFEIIDKTELYPEYLMMWFRRGEFDRRAWFTTDNSIRGSFSWEDMCEMQLPIPDIEVQKEIVKEYKTIINRIKINNQFIQKCEETAQAIYKQWFVDFEFPDVNEKPYKSSEGEMEYNEDLDQEIPKGWKVKKFDEVAKISAGGDRPKVYSTIKKDKCLIPIYSNGTTDEGLYGYTDEPRIRKSCITISARGTIGYCVLRKEPFVPIIRLLVVIPNEKKSINYIYKYIDNFDFDSSGSVQGQLTKPQFSTLRILMPKTEKLEHFDRLISTIFVERDNRKDENTLLQQLIGILLKKMTKLIPIEVTQ